MKRALMVLAVFTAFTAAWADDKDTVKVIHEQDRTIVRKKTVVDFSEVNVEGDLTKPEGSYVLERRKAGFESRIKIRKGFEPELQKSVDSL